MTLLKIANGTVYDPANNVNGVVQDIWIQDGKIVAPPAANAPARRTRSSTRRAWSSCPAASTCTAHIAGPKVNLARKMRPEDKRKRAGPCRTAITRSGTTGSVPSTFATGYLYAGLGYTTAFDAAIPPLAARHAHEEFARYAHHRQGLFRPLGNNHYVLQADCTTSEPERLRAFVAWLLNATKAYAVKIVNPGGVEVWKQGGGNISRSRRQGRALRRHAAADHHALAQAAIDLGLPHPVHIHCNNLGLPGNWKTTLATMEALEGRRGPSDAHPVPQLRRRPRRSGQVLLARSPPLADYVNAHADLTVDVGQVLFGETTTMTGDGPLGYFLHKVTGRKWYQRRHRNGSRLRHRAHHLQGQEPGARPAMGHRAGMVSAGRTIPGAWP